MYKRQVKGSTLDAYYEAAHLGESPKSIYASVRCHYTKCNIINALKKIDNSIYLIGGDAIEFMEDRLNEYKEYNPAIEYAPVSYTHLDVYKRQGGVESGDEPDSHH